MTAPCGRPDCPTTERRQGERRMTTRQNFAWCARVMGAMVVATSLLSITSAVSISTHLAARRQADSQRIHDFQQQQYLSLQKRVAALETRSYTP